MKTLAKPAPRIEMPWEPYTPTDKNPWNAKLAAHLFRRATFGASVRQVDLAVKNGFLATLDQLFDLSAASSFDDEMATSGRVLAGGEDSTELSAWWLLRMVRSPCPLLEKMTLFWHGHFATGAEKVVDARAMLKQNKLLRQHALGHFEDLVQGISKNPAMLIYLDSTENRKTRPNENYARELLELFCLGPGNYTEKDIKEIARCFTGWEVRRAVFRFNKHQHDSGTKSFFGESGQLTGEQAVRVVLDQSAATAFLARKMIRFFVFDNEEMNDDLVKPIADHLRETDFDIASTLKKILGSRLFFSQAAIAQKIKSPVELAVGTLKFLEAQANMRQITQRLERLGQLPFYPPNVKGWDGGTSWINASTIIARANLVSSLVTSSGTRYQAGDLKTWYRKHRRILHREQFSGLDEYWLAGKVTEETAEMLDSLVDTPRDLLSAIASLPEFQLN